MTNRKFTTKINICYAESNDVQEERNIKLFYMFNFQEIDILVKCIHWMQVNMNENITLLFHLQNVFKDERQIINVFLFEII